jgi:hypothetical protein
MNDQIKKIRRQMRRVEKAASKNPKSIVRLDRLAQKYESLLKMLERLTAYQRSASPYA